MALLVACVTFISTGLGGLAAIRFRDRLHLLLGFSPGAVLAVVFFDVLPEVFATRNTDSPIMLAAAAGFLAFFGLERYTALHRSREHAHRAGEHEAELGVLGAAGLSLHSFLDGVAINRRGYAPDLSGDPTPPAMTDGLQPSRSKGFPIPGDQVK